MFDRLLWIRFRLTGYLIILMFGFNEVMLINYGVSILQVNS